MASIIAATGVQQGAQVQQTQSTPKVAKPETKGAAPEDTVSISSEGHAAQQATQTESGSK
jgi:hypothetical protein